MRVHVRFFIFHLLLILILSFQAIPQNYISENKLQFNRLTHQQGFPARYILCMLQDSKGFLWMAAQDRLIRFDGKRQKLFRYSRDDKNSIGSNTVRAMCEDKNGVLWFGTTGGGLNRYNSSTENFTRYTHNPQNPNSISSNDVSAIHQDRDGILWIGTLGGGLNKFNSLSGKFIQYKYNPDDINSISDNNVTVVYEDSKENLWVGTSKGGLNKFDHDRQKFVCFRYNASDLNSLSSNNVTGIYEDKSGNLWISTMGGGLNKLNFDTQNNRPIFSRIRHNPNDKNSLSSDDVSTMYVDREKIIWAGTTEGLNKLLLNNKITSISFIHYKHNDLDIFSLNDNYVNCIYEDNSGMLWISTGGAGLHVVDKRQKQFKLYANEPNNKYSLSSTGVISVYEDRTGIRWIGTLGGLNKMEKGSEKFIHYKHNPFDPNSLSDNSVSAIYEDKFGVLWIGTWNGGLNKFDRKTNKFYRYKNDSRNQKSISDNRIFSIKEDPLGNLWIATANGLDKFNRIDENFEHYKHNPKDPNSISSDNIYELYYDQQSNLLIATTAGLDAFNAMTEEFTHFDLSAVSSDSTRTVRVTSLRQSKNGIMWIGTFDKGLVKYDLRKGVIRTYTAKDGFPIDYITGIIEDDHANLWISTPIGVTKFDPHKETMRTYIYEDGIQGIGEMTPYKSKTGELLFGGVMGLSIFHPDAIQDYTHLPPVIFTDFYLFNNRVPIGYDSLTNRAILDKSLIETDELKLYYDDNVLTFDFAILDFHSLFKWNKFAYKLEGFNKNWIYSETSRSANNRSVTFTNLNPGEYTLKVKAANSDDIWNEDYASLKLIILPPWYRTLWAYLMYVILIGSIIYFTWKSQLKRIRIRQEVEMSKFETQKLHEVDELKSRFFTNISHEFRTPLTLIIGPVKQLIDRINDEKIKDDLNMVHRNANRLLNLVNQLLDISKLESGSMKLHSVPVNLSELLKALTLSFTSYAERKNIILKFSSVLDNVLVYVDKDKLEKIFINIMSNAFKFTPEGGKIEVKINESQVRSDEYRYVEISITDTGIGIPEDKLPRIFDRFYQVDSSHTREQEGTGIGLSLTKELVELHKGKIEVASEEGKGTIVTIRLPLGKEHLKSDVIFEDEIEQKVTLPEEIGIHTKNIHTDNESEQTNSLPQLLIVEDNSDVRKYIKDNLSKEYKVSEAIDGEDGLNKAVRLIPDIIISDVMMPKMDGFKLCEKLKTDERTSHIPIILLTAKATKKDKIDGFELGADEYIMKPFDTDELAARLRNLVIQRKRLHDHFRKNGILDFETTEITSINKKFLQKTLDVIKQHISDTSFSVELLSENLAISRSVLHKKISSLLGIPPVELIRELRLKKAIDLIENNFGNLSEIALEVGFSNPAYFSEVFKKQYGISPKEYHQKINHN